MAPACWGEHARVKCDECEFSFRVGRQKDKLPEKLVCPNCGYRSIHSSKADPQPAQLVRVDSQNSASSRKLGRWDIVAIRPSKGRPAMIKRVIGLPGESIEIGHGEVFADGAIVRKPLNVAREMRVTVFDSLFGSAEVLRRFLPQHGARDWKVMDGSWQFSPSSGSSGTQWLAYQQWRCVANRLPRAQPVPVEDWYAANVGINRDLNVTHDIWASLECQIEENGRFDLKLDRGSASHRFALDFATKSVTFDGRSYPMRDSGFSSSRVAAGLSVVVEVCTFDRQMTLLIDGSEVVSVDLTAADGRAEAASYVQIGGVTSKLRIERFRLWRDIYYFDVVRNRKLDGSIALRAGVDEYLLMGDNVPISIDSRHWPSPAVSADQILGTVSLEH